MSAVLDVATELREMFIVKIQLYGGLLQVRTASLHSSSFIKNYGSAQTIRFYMKL